MSDEPNTAVDPADIADLLPHYAHTAMACLRDAGKQAFVVGGFVRDALMGSGAHDVDIATDARWYQTTDIFEERGWRVVATGAKHGTVTAIVEGRPVEITTFRTDGVYSDHRRPDSVRFVSDVNDDLARRDFTVNAMAWNPDSGLVDPFGGADDIRARTIRSVGVADERFEEDALRVMRGVRFSSQLSFSVDPATEDAIHAHVDDLSHVAIERVAREYDGIVRGAGAVEALRRFPDVAAKAVPPIARMVGFEQRSRWHVYDVWEHCLHALDALPSDASGIVRHVTLLHDIGKPATFSLGDDGYAHFYGHEEQGARLIRRCLAALRWKTLDVTVASTLVRFHDHHIDPSPRGVRRILAKIARSFNGHEDLVPDVFLDLLAIKRADTMAHSPSCINRRLKELDAVERTYAEFLEENRAFCIRDLAVNGQDVIDAGIGSGPIVGATLRRLLSAVIEGSVPNERGALLEQIESVASDPSAPVKTAGK